MDGRQDVLNQQLLPKLDDFSGNIGVSIQALDGCFDWQYHQDLLLATASTIKLFVLGALLEGVAEGRLSLAEKITFADAEKITGSGILRDMHAGTLLCSYDVALMMMVISDNTATNLLVDFVGGLAVVQAHMKKHGVANTKLNRKMSEDPIVMNTCEIARGCSGEFVQYLIAMHKGEILPPEQLAVFDFLLERQHYKNFVPAYLPLAEEWEDCQPTCWPNTKEPVYAACKTGWMTGVRCDVGYLTISGKEYAYAVLSSDCKDLQPSAANEATKLLNECGVCFYHALCEE